MSPQNSELTDTRTFKPSVLDSIFAWLKGDPSRQGGQIELSPQELYKFNCNLLRKSPLFDAEWYLDHNTDVKQHGIDPVEHYVKYGAFEGRFANRLFDSAWYLKTYPDVAKSGQNPLVHYILHGASEGRYPHPSFIRQNS